MADGIDMIDVVSKLGKRPRARSCIVLTHEFKEQKIWAKRLAEQAHMAHIDLLDLFNSDENLAANLSSFVDDRLLNLLKTKKDTPVLIVSGIEFLKASWSGNTKAIDQLVARLETWSKKPALMFVMQYDKQLANRKLIRHPQYDFVIDQKDTLALV